MSFVDSEYVDEFNACQPVSMADITRAGIYAQQNQLHLKFKCPGKIVSQNKLPCDVGPCESCKWAGGRCEYC